MKKTMIAILFAAVLATPALGQSDDDNEKRRAEYPGYVTLDLGSAIGDEKPGVSILFEGPMLQMAAAAVKEARSPLASLFDSLKLVQVRVFEDFGADPATLFETAKGVVNGWKSAGWTQTVNVPEESELVNILVRTTDDSIQGLIVFVVEDDEVVFVNLVGEIDPVELGKLLGGLGQGLISGDLDFEELLFSPPGGDDSYEDDDEEDSETGDE